MFYDDIFVPTEVYPKKPLYELESWGAEAPREPEKVLMKPGGMKMASEIVKIEAPNLDVLKMKEKM